MGRFKVIKETDITIKDKNCLDLRDFLKIKQAIKIDDKYYIKKIIKSNSGNHLFEIYDEIYTENKSYKTLLNEINDKLNILLNIKQ